MEEGDETKKREGERYARPEASSRRYAARPSGGSSSHRSTPTEPSEEIVGVGSNVWHGRTEKGEVAERTLASSKETRRRARPSEECSKPWRKGDTERRSS